MTEDDIRAKVAHLVNMLKTEPSPKSPADAKILDAMIIGAELLGEVFVDIKRASDALEMANAETLKRNNPLWVMDPSTGVAEKVGP